MDKQIKINYMTNANPMNYDTICPKSRASKVGFDNDNSTQSPWGDYNLHTTLSATNVSSAFEEVQDRMSIYGKVVENVQNGMGDLVGMCGYGNMAIYVAKSNTHTIQVYNTITHVSSTIELPQINELTPIIKDVAIIKIDKQIPNVGLLCYVGSDVYYVAYDILSANALNPAISYSRVSAMVDGDNSSISSRFLRTKKEIVILNGTMGRVDNVYGEVGRVMRSVDGESFDVLEKLNGENRAIYMPLKGSMYCGDDTYSATCVFGDNATYHPLVFTIDGNDMNIHLEFEQGAFNPLGRDLNTGHIMFSSQQGWWEVMPNGELNNFATFTSTQIPTSMMCVNGLKITNAGYYYNADGLSTGRPLIDTSGKSIAPTPTQQLLKLYRVNDKMVYIYAPSLNKWYMTTLSTSI